MNRFLDTYNGRMKGVLRWHQFEQLWQQIAEEPGWYLYAIGATPPDETLPTAELKPALEEIAQFLRAEHEADYCGVVYADDLEQPSLLKIYHPKKMGASCGSSGATVLPMWTLSRQLPIDLLAWALEKDQKPAWWRQLLKKRD